jgi:hypothetical protein
VDGPRSRSGRFGDDKNLFPLQRIEPRLLLPASDPQQVLEMRDEGMKLLSFTHFHSYIRPNIIIIVIITIILINNNNKGTANNPWASSSKDKRRSLVVSKKQGGRGLL